MDDSDDEDEEYEFEDAQNLFDVIAEMFMQRCAGAKIEMSAQYAGVC